MQYLLKLIKDEIIGEENTILAWSCLVGAAAIIVMGFYLSSPSMSFIGIAGSRESNINFEYPVEVKRVHVITGQKVKKGDLLLELNQFDIDTRIRQLNASITKLQAEKSVRDQLNTAIGNQYETKADPLTLEIKDLQLELSYLEKQRKNLLVFSEIDGIVGSVNFKRGEKAPNFSSLITISSESPTFVQGFVHEKMHSNIKTGALVNVESLATGEATSYGKVVSVGSRIVAMPDRLANNLGQISYGREIIVEIPSNTQLLLGEKVQISPRSRILSAFVAMASSKENKNSIEEPQLFTVPAALSERSSFESSGAIYLADLNKYLIVSDDTDNLDTPWMFYSSPEGEIDDEPVQIPGVKEIIDMESISSDGNYIYVMSSLKSSKKGKSKTERNLLVQLERKGFDFQHIKTINIGKILREKLSTSNNEILKSFRNQDLNNLEVEGHAVKNNTLYIAIKSPLTSEGRSLIVALPKLNSDMPGDLNVIANVAFNHKKEQQISDFVFSGEQIFIATTCVDGSKCGALWEAKEKTLPTPSLIRYFDSDRPEGIALNREKQNLFITFDGGDKKSKFLRIPKTLDPIK